VQAAINAVHSDPPPTDWRQVVQLYDHLLVLTPSPVVGLNRAVAVAEVDGPGAALALVDGLAAGGASGRSSMADYHLFHAVRADLLRRLGRDPEAARAYRRALELAGNDAERDLLRRRLSAVAGSGRPPPAG
jgi:RNA polymerase sigma-70 factor (ECF subfamily)